MKARTPVVVTVWATLALLAALTCAAPAAGQMKNELPPNYDPMAEMAPIKCWWRASAGAITLGEPFDVRLTCAVLETEKLQVVADETRLTVAGIPLKPFEVIGGSHPEDTRTGDRRFFQYLYTLRLIDPNAIGQDVSVPKLPITYKIQSRIAEESTVTGRDFIYVMPDLSIRVVAQVPNDINDIRDGSDIGLERVDALNFRARLFDMGALASFAGAALLGVLALYTAVTASRPQKVREKSRVGDRRVLAAAGGELSRVAREAESGWTPELVSAGHAALRVVAGLALGNGVSERPLKAKETAEAGRIAVRSPRPGGVGAAVTSSTTPADVSAAMKANADLNGVNLSGLRDALSAFTAAQFKSITAKPDAAALSQALDTGRTEASQLARARLWQSIRRTVTRRAATS